MHGVGGLGEAEREGTGQMRSAEGKRGRVAGTGDNGRVVV